MLFRSLKADFKEIKENQTLLSEQIAEIKSDVDATKNRIDSSTEVLEKRVKELTDVSTALKEKVQPVPHRMQMLNLKFDKTVESLSVLAGTVLELKSTIDTCRESVILPPPPTPSTVRIKPEIDFDKLDKAIPMTAERRAARAAATAVNAREAARRRAADAAAAAAAAEPDFAPRSYRRTARK